MAKTLQMVFRNEAGKNVNFNLPYIKEDLTADQVKSVMGTIISKNIMDSKGGALVAVVSASIVSRDAQEISVK